MIEDSLPPFESKESSTFFPTLLSLFSNKCMEKLMKFTLEILARRLDICFTLKLSTGEDDNMKW
jgi:hypothetical protein